MNRKNIKFKRPLWRVVVYSPTEFGLWVRAKDAFSAARIVKRRLDKKKMKVRVEWRVRVD